MKKNKTSVSQSQEMAVEAYIAQYEIFEKTGRLDTRKTDRRKRERRRAIVYVEEDRRSGGSERRLQQERRWSAKNRHPAPPRVRRETPKRAQGMEQKANNRNGSARAFWSRMAALFFNQKNRD